MLQRSVWNQPDVLVSEGQYVGTDDGYHDTDHINVMKPFKKAELDSEPALKIWNKDFNRDRQMIERSFGIVKNRFTIFDMPWKRDIDIFPVALRVCLKLLNRYWRVSGTPPPGMKKKLKQMEMDY